MHNVTSYLGGGMGSLMNEALPLRGPWDPYLRHCVVTNVSEIPGLIVTLIASTLKTRAACFLGALTFTSTDTRYHNTHTIFFLF